MSLKKTKKMCDKRVSVESWVKRCEKRFLQRVIFFVVKRRVKNVCEFLCDGIRRYKKFEKIKRSG
jgi:hypothetical protein